MKKYLSLWAIALAALACFVLPACDKAKDDPKQTDEPANIKQGSQVSKANALIGTWRMSGTFGQQAQIYGVKVYMQFKSESQMISIHVSRGADGKEESIVVPAFYQRVGDILTAKAVENLENGTKILSLTKDKLVLQGEQEGKPIPIEFSRVPDAEIAPYLARQ